MINLKIKRSIKDNTVIAFTVSGHAKFAKRAGKLDIVCAAVSGIVYAALGYMDEYYGMNDFTLSDGYVHWELPKDISDDVKNKIGPVIDAMVIGIKQIEVEYSEKYVRVVIEEV